MRVGYLTYGLDRSPTGIGRYAMELLRALANAAESHTLSPDIVLLTTERDDPQGLWKDFEHHPLSGCYLLPLLTTYGNVALSAAIRNHRLDLVHDPNGIAPFLGPSAGARRIVTIHDAFAYVYPEKHNRLDNWRYRWLLPRAARKADAIITVSRCSRHDLAHALRLREDRFRITTEGVNSRFGPVPDSPDRRALLTRYGIVQPYVLYVGGINPRKNVSRLFAAFARVIQDCATSGLPAPQLVLAGKRQWRTEEIEKTFQQLELAPHVRFTGYIDDSDLPTIYSGAELLAFPSLYEGYGLPPLEAMACGTPVVTSNISSLPEVVGDVALLVDPEDVEALAAAMMRVLTGDVLRMDMRRRGLIHSAGFTWARAAHETLNVYQEVLSAVEAHEATAPAGERA